MHFDNFDPESTDDINLISLFCVNSFEDRGDDVIAPDTAMRL